MLPTRALRQSAPPKINIKKALQLIYGSLSVDAPVQKVKLKQNLEQLINQDETLSKLNNSLDSKITLSSTSSKSQVSPPLVSRLYDSTLQEPAFFRKEQSKVNEGEEYTSVAKAPQYISQTFPGTITHINQRTNVLFHKTVNPFLVKEDFLALAPRAAAPSTHPDKIFDKDWQLDDFELYKARDLKFLNFANGYYLIFKDHSYACAFYAETAGKSLEGMPFLTVFLEQDFHLKYNNLAQLMIGEKLNIKENKNPKTKKVEFQILVTKTTNVSEPNYIIRDRLSSSKKNTENDNLKVFSPSELVLLKQAVEKLKPIDRNHCVVVHNLPYVLSAKGVIDHFLLNYDLYPDFAKAVRLLAEDEECRYKAWLVAFDNKDDPVRFARRYHGKYLDDDINYPKVLVDILDY